MLKALEPGICGEDLKPNCLGSEAWGEETGWRWSPGHTDRSCWWGSCKFGGRGGEQVGRKRKRKRGEVWASVGEAGCQEQRARS